MINIAELEQYFPDPNRPVRCLDYTFTISLSQDEHEEIFIVNLKIKQSDTKEDHLIKFRLGLGRDRETDSVVHDTAKPHFEVDFYKREKDSFSAALYFTLNGTDEDKLLEYAKGTVFIISKIIKNFFHTHGLNIEDIQKIVYDEAVSEELKKFEPILVEALYQCYKESQLVIREGKQAMVIKTEHNLSKYLGQKDLEPLFLPLLKRVKESK